MVFTKDSSMLMIRVNYTNHQSAIFWITKDLCWKNPVHFRDNTWRKLQTAIANF